jgi:hypothetical protein
MIMIIVINNIKYNLNKFEDCLGHNFNDTN